MALSGGVQVEGLNALTRDLQSLGLEADDLKDAFGEIASQGAHLASSFAPKRTGKLAASIRGNRAKNKAIVLAGKARVPYAGAINYGWSEGKRNLRAKPRRGGGWPIGIRASSFMQRADEAMQPIALQALDDALVRAVQKRGMA